MPPPNRGHPGISNPEQLLWYRGRGHEWEASALDPPPALTNATSVDVISLGLVSMAVRRGWDWRVSLL